MSTKFKEYVTEQAFALTLSKRMCEAMEFVVRDDVSRELGMLTTMPEHFPVFATLAALRERGLVTSVGKPSLTDAGRLLYPILAHAELVTPRNTIRVQIGGPNEKAA